MGMGFALGTGFINAANKQIDDNENEDRQTRKLAMEVWLKDTLPKVQAARAQDNATVSQMNSLLADDYFKGNPGLAWTAAKGVQNGVYKSFDEFKQGVDSGKINLPPEVLNKQKEQLGQYFNMSTDDTGRVNSMTLKPQDATQPLTQLPVPKSGILDGLFNKRNPAEAMNKSAKEFHAMTGIDPLNPQITPKTQSINVEGATVPTVDAKAEARAREAMGQIIKEPDRVTNFDEVNREYAANGPQAALKIAKYVPEEEAYQRKYERGMQQAVANTLIEHAGDFKDPTKMLRDMAQGKASKETILNILTDNGNKMMSAEDKQMMQQRVEKMFPKNAFSASMLFADRQLFEKLVPDPAARALWKSTAMNYEQMANQSSISKTMEAVGNQAGAAGAGAAASTSAGRAFPLTPEEQATQTPAKQPAPTGPTAKPAAATPEQQIKALETAAQSDQPITKEPSPPKMKGEREGESILGKISIDQDVRANVRAAKPEYVQKTNPLAVMKILKEGSNTPTNKAAIARNTVFNINDVYALHNNTDASKLFDEQIAPFLSDDASKTPIGAFFLYKDPTDGVLKTTWMTPKLKEKIASGK